MTKLFQPAEQSERLVRPLDYVLSIGIALASFVTLFVNYWLPAGKIFDEVYFARAAEDYLTRQYIYENTHPPITKLLITLSTMMFGGMHGGDNAHGWRFLDVVFGAASVWLLYILAKRVTKSSLFASYASILFALDGMHFVQSRIATPESFVCFFSIASLYTFLRYWQAVQADTPFALVGREWLVRGIGALACVVLAIAGTLVRFPHESRPAIVLCIVWASAGLYLAYRLLLEPRWLAPRAPAALPGERSGLWLALFATSIALLVTSKWYGIMSYGVAFVVVLGVWFQRKRPARWGNPRAFPLDVIFCVVVFVTGSIYAAAYTPQFIGLSDQPTSAPRAYTFTDVVTMQYNAFEYHEHLNDGGRNQHPYASKWWQWPLDLRPILYAAEYGGSGPTATAAMVYTLPNPLILWLGLLTVPWVGFLGLRERNKGYALIVLAYLLQWLPWMASPRIAFAYHFYVDIPLICLCNAIAAQRFWLMMREYGRDGIAARAVVVGYLLAVVISFVYFYPILAGVTIPTHAWMQRMWLHSWI